MGRKRRRGKRGEGRGGGGWGGGKEFFFIGCQITLYSIIFHWWSNNPLVNYFSLFLTNRALHCTTVDVIHDVIRVTVISIAAHWLGSPRDVEWRGRGRGIREGEEEEVKEASREFPGGPVVRTQCFQCGGPGLTSGWETKILQAV